MILMKILHRTFFIKGVQYGSAFTIDVDSIQYLVTAKHLLDTSKRQFELLIFRDNMWVSTPVTVVGHGNGEIDISVLRADSELTPPGFDVALSVGDLALGQDIYFLGFPYKMWADGGSLMDGHPLPFAKKGALSSMSLGNPKVLYIDAINNEGFSGGPLFFYPYGKPNELRIAGIVSKFRIEYEVILDEHGDPTKMTVPYNTGFLVAYGISHALQIIRPRSGT